MNTLSIFKNWGPVIFIVFQVAIITLMSGCSHHPTQTATPAVTTTPALTYAITDEPTPVAKETEEDMSKESKARELAQVYVAQQMGSDDIEITLQALTMPEVHELLADHYVFEITIYNALPPSVIIVVVSSDEQVWQMPAEFNAMLRRQDLTITEATAGLRLLSLYVQLSQRGEDLILDSYKDIPFEEQYWEDPRTFENTIQPPQIQEIDAGYQYTVYVWHELGGRLAEWHCAVTHQGEVIISEINRIADRLGDAVVVQ